MGANKMQRVSRNVRLDRAPVQSSEAALYHSRGEAEQSRAEHEDLA